MENDFEKTRTTLPETPKPETGNASEIETSKKFENTPTSTESEAAKKEGQLVHEFREAFHVQGYFDFRSEYNKWKELKQLYKRMTVIGKDEQEKALYQQKYLESLKKIEEFRGWATTQGSLLLNNPLRVTGGDRHVNPAELIVDIDTLEDQLQGMQDSDEKTALSLKLLNAKIDLTEADSELAPLLTLNNQLETEKNSTTGNLEAVNESLIS